MPKIILANCLLAFRPNIHTHEESGFPCFDLAYYSQDTKQYHIIGSRSDHIALTQYFHLTKPEGLNMDNKDGWCRIWKVTNLNQSVIKWSGSDLSTAWINDLTNPNETIEI